MLDVTLVYNLLQYFDIKHFRETRHMCVIAGFHRKVDGNCTLLGYYTASSGNFLLTFLDRLVPKHR
jgi:hypothetical protein